MKRCRTCKKKSHICFQCVCGNYYCTYHRDLGVHGCALKQQVALFEFQKLERDLMKMRTKVEKI